MRRLVFSFALLTLWLAATPLSRADDWSKTYTITGKPDLRVETSDADLHVDTWDQNTIDVHVTSTHYKIGESGIKIIEHQTGDTVELEIRYPHMDFNIGFSKSHRVNWIFTCPAKAGSACGRVTVVSGWQISKAQWMWKVAMATRRLKPWTAP